MAKSWSQVEQSQKYMNLPPQSQIQAKKEYWDNVVSSKPQYNTLDEKSKQKAKSEFFGGTLVEDMPESEFQPKNIALETAKQTGLQIGKSAVSVPVNIVKGVGTMIRHPLQTGKAIGGTAVGLAQKAIPGEQKQERYADALIEGVQNRYGGREVYDERIGQTVPAYAKTVSEDPFGFLLDVYAVAGAAGGAARGVGKLTGSKTLQKAGSFPMTAQATKKTGTAIKSSKPYQSAFPAKTQRVNQVVDAGIKKAIRPSVVGKRTASQSAKYNNNAREAVKTIVENKNNLRFTDDFGDTVNRLPKDLNEFSQAIQQTKSQVYNYYDDLLKRAGEQKGAVDLGKAVNKLDDVINNKTLQIHDPSVIKHAQNVQERLMNVGKLGVKETDELIKSYNNSLKAFYRNPTYDSATKASVDAMIANNLRSSLDDVVSGITGKAFQPVKNKYGALKAIERDVNRRAIVAGRQNIKGLIDFTDIFSAGDVVRGITGFNPASVSKGLAQMAIKKTFKKINDPNNIVKKMFETVDKYHDPLPDVITPEILSNLPTPIQKAIQYRKAQKIGYGTKALPSPKDVPYYNTSGIRNVGQSSIKIPSTERGGIVYGQSPYSGTSLPATIPPTPRARPTTEQIRKIMRMKSRGKPIRGIREVRPKQIIER